MSNNTVVLDLYYLNDLIKYRSNTEKISLILVSLLYCDTEMFFQSVTACRWDQVWEPTAQLSAVCTLG